LWNWRWRVHEKCDQVDPSLTSAQAQEWRLVGAEEGMNRFPRSCDSAP
jgi:hypothetical protein